MKMRALHITILFVFILNIGFAQLKVSKTQVTFDMNYFLGMQPNTVRSTGIAKKTQMPADVLATYPMAIGKPENITKQIEYYFIQNGLQFAFQNYCEKKTSKEFFLNEVSNHIWNLADTIHLSRTPIRCGFSVMAGLENDSVPVFIVDANNNNDYSDEVVRQIRKDISNTDTIMSLSIPITKDNFIDGKVTKEAINCYISSASPGNQVADLSFCFPAFRYNSFVYNGKPYILWTPMDNYTEEVFLQAGISGVPIPKYENPINLGQFVVLDGVPFKLKSVVGSGARLILEGADYSGFDPRSISAKVIKGNATNNMRSSQVGFLAPIIQGTRISNEDKPKELISLDQFKGKYVFIDFWSTTCAPCIQDFPEIMKSYDKFTRAQFEIIGVVDERSAGSAQNLVAKHQLKWPNLKINTEGTITKGYNVVSYPTTYLLDKEGKIIAQDLRGKELLEKLKSLIN
ncbi:MAG: TlpA family protein disulfide reductase [Pedobacter sp.]|nr:MAG: TlpA family protein disulfide reductase [Pedobacter sp.]